jgi:hypothetical protein
METNKTNTDIDDDDLRSFGWFYGAIVYCMLLTPIAVVVTTGLVLTDAWAPFRSGPTGGLSRLQSLDGLVDDIVANAHLEIRIATIWAIGLALACLFGAVAGRMSLHRRLKQRRNDPVVRGEVIRERMLQRLDAIGRTFTLRTKLEDVVRRIRIADATTLADMEPCLSDLKLVQHAFARSLEQAVGYVETDAVRDRVFSDVELAVRTALAAPRTLDAGDASVVARYMDSKYRAGHALEDAT